MKTCALLRIQGNFSGSLPDAKSNSKVTQSNLGFQPWLFEKTTGHPSSPDKDHPEYTDKRISRLYHQFKEVKASLQLWLVLVIDDIKFDFSLSSCKFNDKEMFNQTELFYN